MFKENVPSSPHEMAAAATITVEQRARITRNFRAAKALLSRKRPLESTNSPLPSPKCSATNESNPRGFPAIRRPLSDVRNGLAFQNEFSTPMKFLGACSIQRKEVVPSSSILDEDLDESFIEEADSICEKMSCLKEEKLKPEKERKESSEMEERLSFSEDLRCDLMQKKYHDYLQSLNDAQREAAHSDISVALMIVVGPGSGKTSTMVGRVLNILKEEIGPANVLAMTFTIATASDMRDRIGSVAGKGGLL